MNKAKKYAINGAIIIGIGNAILNAINQISNQEGNKQFNWKELFEALGKGALIGGTGGLVIGALKDDDMSKTLIATGGSSGFVKEVLNNYCDTDISLPRKAQKIQKKLHCEFKEYLSEYPSINGSLVKGTEIQNSDIDIHLKFNRNADNIESLRNSVEDYLNERFYDGSLIKVRNQNHSIGLVFDLKGKEKRIDIVPMREIDNGKGDTYLYSKRNNSIKKTNAQKQNTNLKFTEKQKQIIKLLKGWKIDNELQLPSILIEYIVKRLFTENRVPYRIDRALLFVIQYIANRITNLRIIDISNSNNVISDCITYDQKVSLKNFCNKMLQEIEMDERNILDYFKY